MKASINESTTTKKSNLSGFRNLYEILKTTINNIVPNKLLIIIIGCDFII